MARQQDWEWKGNVNTKPDFNQLLKVLSKDKPARATLFEFLLNETLHDMLSAGNKIIAPNADYEFTLKKIYAFWNAGYDYVVVGIPDFSFPHKEQNKEKTISLNEGAVIFDRNSLDKYQWLEPENADYQILNYAQQYLPAGMKAIVCCPGGVLENAISLIGYENMCALLADDRKVVEDVFENVGRRLVKLISLAVKHSAVGAIISNDDWGFKSQTMLSPADMRELVFPWHKMIVEEAHKQGKPAILHSCGNLREVMDDVIDYMKFDGKHSFEDSIEPVEVAYKKYGSRIAILGGIDVDFVARSKPEAIYKRAKAMLELSQKYGSYALGTGNSVPEYVPKENYFAMIEAAIEERR
jgi:uroporphyrinogen decarboxylase